MASWGKFTKTSFLHVKVGIQSQLVKGTIALSVGGKLGRVGVSLYL